MHLAVWRQNRFRPNVAVSKSRCLRALPVSRWSRNLGPFSFRWHFARSIQVPPVRLGHGPHEAVGPRRDATCPPYWPGIECFPPPFLALFLFSASHSRSTLLRFAPSWSPVTHTDVSILITIVPSLKNCYGHTHNTKQ